MDYEVVDKNTGEVLIPRDGWDMVWAKAVELAFTHNWCDLIIRRVG